ncbi:MAG TPA: PLDc N-terminal domain-containing protein [Anaerolineaceae bacterium]|nr:PLDc N-terminal domain-containing protein [Anaerolineaceae bacterium]
MYHYGFGFAHVLMQVFIFLLLIGWVVASIVALFALRQAKLSSISKALWVLIILGIPVLGVIAYFIIRPTEEE